MNRADWHDHLLPAGNTSRAPERGKSRQTFWRYLQANLGFDTRTSAHGAGPGPSWRLHRRMETRRRSPVPSVAFCGIARPQQFFAGLRSAGLSLAAEIAFADHYRYAANEIENLVASARRKGATALITTEKDEIRLHSLKSAIPAELPLEVARLTVEIEDEQNAVVTIEELLSNTRLAQGHRKASQR